MNNDLPPVIVSSGPPAPTPAPQKSLNIGLILIVVLGLGTIVFGVVAISALGHASTATSTLAAAKAAAASDARTAQKAEDDKAATAANASPYRNYTAPNAYGGFVINFPKDWSATVDEEEEGNVQVNLVINPNFIRTVNGINDLAAAKVQLVAQLSSDYLQAFSGSGITQTPITVSGIKSTQLTGSLPDKRMTRLVVVPIRDKSLVFINEDSAYAATFDTILAQAKINP